MNTVCAAVGIAVLWLYRLITQVSSNGKHLAPVNNFIWEVSENHTTAKFQLQKVFHSDNTAYLHNEYFYITYSHTLKYCIFIITKLDFTAWRSNDLNIVLYDSAAHQYSNNSQSYHCINSQQNLNKLNFSEILCHYLH